MATELSGGPSSAGERVALIDERNPVSRESQFKAESHGSVIVLEILSDIGREK